MNRLIYEKLVLECIQELSDGKSCSDFSRKSLNSLITITTEVPESVCKKMDKILSYESKSYDFVSVNDMHQTVQVTEKSRMILYRGDVTKLEVSSIVNAANENMLGCFTPGHRCVDNVIHCASGPRLRNECVRIMATKKSLETGGAIITPAYSLPCKYVIHTVGPIISDDEPTREQEKELDSCYANSLQLCKENNIHEIAFTNISTGVFGYPVDLACKTAINSVLKWLLKNKDYKIDVIFCTFTQDNYYVYKEYFQ